MPLGNLNTVLIAENGLYTSPQFNAGDAAVLIWFQDFSLNDVEPMLDFNAWAVTANLGSQVGVSALNLEYRRLFRSSALIQFKSPSRWFFQLQRIDRLRGGQRAIELQAGTLP